MILTYYPDTDTLDVAFRIPERRRADTQQEAQQAARELVQEFAEQSQSGEVETYEADSSGQTLAHYRAGRLEELTIEHATHRAPSDWEIESLRREAAQVAASTGRIVESVTHNLIQERTSFQTGELGPHSPHTSDEAVQDYNRMIDEIEETSAAA